MNGGEHAQAQQALLDLVETDRARQCAQIDGEAAALARTLRTQAQAAARLRLRTTFGEQRQRMRERLAAARARLATQRRLHEQQHTAALLRLATEQLPGELSALWRQDAPRRGWVAQALAMARSRLPAGDWRVVHAPGWSPTEQQALAQAAGPAVHVRFDADPGIAAGLKIVAGRNVIDATLAGLLADRADFEARLLRRLEDRP